MVLSPHVTVQGNTCHLALDHGEVQENTSQESGFSKEKVASLYVLQRSKSPQHSRPQFSVPGVPYYSVLGPTGPPTAPSALSSHPLLLALSLLHGPFLTAPFLTTPSSWMPLPSDVMGSEVALLHPLKAHGCSFMAARLSFRC